LHDDRKASNPHLYGRKPKGMNKIWREISRPAVRLYPRLYSAVPQFSADVRRLVGFR